MWHPIALTIVVPGLTIGQSAGLVLALAIALAAGVAALIVRGWGRSLVPAALGALLFGAVPYLVGQVTGLLTVAVIAIPPLTMFALDELLVGKRRPFLLSGAVLGGLAAAPFERTTGMLLALGASVGAGVVVVALLRPKDSPIQVAHAVKAAITGTVVYTLATVYPLHVQQTGPRSLAASVSDNQSGAHSIVTAVLSPLWQLLLSGSAVSYVVLGIILAGIVEGARRVRS